jgi:phosphoserine aminotransferase
MTVVEERCFKTLIEAQRRVSPAGHLADARCRNFHMVFAHVTHEGRLVPAAKPNIRPANANFSSGPCAKYPGWQSRALDHALLGRSHRSPEGCARLKDVIDRTRRLIELPDDYLLAIVPGSDTGAFELALWNLLGARGADVLAWENFGHVWVTDIVRQLKLKDVRVLSAEFGELPDLRQVDFDRDVVFTANGTTSGVRIPNYDWIAKDRAGLTFVDATSAILAQPVDWSKTDVLTFSWQKVLGGEAAHGMLALSPRAVERLESYTPPWPLPKLFRIVKDGRVDRAIFEGETINTPSMLCVEDCLNALSWAESIGGQSALHARADRNAKVLFDWIARTPWVENLARDPSTWSNTSVCLRFCDPEVMAMSLETRLQFAHGIAKVLAGERAAFDVASYRGVPPGLRIWTGATVETADIEAVLPWIEWAFLSARDRLDSP